MISNECWATKKKGIKKRKQVRKKQEAKGKCLSSTTTKTAEKIASRDISKNIILLPFSFFNVTRDWCETCIKWLLGDFPALFQITIVFNVQALYIFIHNMLNTN